MPTRSFIANLFFAILLSGLCGPLCPSAFSEPPSVIGIFGDAHGNVANAHKVFQTMKHLGVTHVVGMGDYNKFGERVGRPPRPEDEDYTTDPQELATRAERALNHAISETTQILGMISGVAGVSKERTFLIPGNFEIADDPAATRKLLDTLLAFGQLVSLSDREAAEIEIAGKKIFVSHVALQTLPQALTPQGRFLLRRQKAAMETELVTPKGIDLRIFADTHMSGAYIEPPTGTLVINPGVLVDWKDPNEPYGFAVYRPAQNQVEFHTLDQPNPRVVLDLKALDSPTCRAFLSRYR